MVQITLDDLKRTLEPHGLTVIRKRDLENLQKDFYLHEYESYEQYREVQIFHNKRKINAVWADGKTLDLVAQRVQQQFSGIKLKALCHGTRNGFEQNYLAKKLNADIIGTDISDTATDYPSSVQWDFHDENLDWLNKHDFIYTNSLDQSWQPKVALTTWLNQLRVGGLMIIEHTILHSPEGASEMDPFGVKPAYMPYVLSDWFGHRISTEVIKSVKGNNQMDVWLFVVKKLVEGKIST